MGVDVLRLQAPELLDVFPAATVCELQRRRHRQLRIDSVDALDCAQRPGDFERIVIGIAEIDRLRRSRA